MDKHVPAGDRRVESGQRPQAQDLVYMLSTRKFRERQYNLYNEEVCPGGAHAPRQAAGNTIVILGEGGHKALDLKCTSNGLILTTMPGGKFQQTQGRVKRSCAFKKLMDETGLWRVQVRTYLLWDEGCLTSGPLVDQALHSFYEAQYQIIRYLEMLEAMAGIGCSNWEVYSDWKRSFADVGDPLLGGFHCVFDEDPALLRTADPTAHEFFRCVDYRIEPAMSGDVSAAYVAQSTLGKCGRAASAASAASASGASGALRASILAHAHSASVEFAAPSEGNFKYAQHLHSPLHSQEDSQPLHSQEDSQPLHSQLLHSQEDSQPLHSQAHSQSLHSQAHSQPLHSQPLHSQPLHSQAHSQPLHSRAHSRAQSRAHPQARPQARAQDQHPSRAAQSKASTEDSDVPRSASKPSLASHARILEEVRRAAAQWKGS
jgi:hypothetical protein